MLFTILLNKRLKSIYFEEKPQLRAILVSIWAFIKDWRNFIAFGIAWMITNGWAYLMFFISLALKIKWMKIVSGTYLAFLYLPCTPEKLVTIPLAVFIKRCLFSREKNRTINQSIEGNSLNCVGETMALTRADLEAKLEGLENKDDVINYIMAENGKSINAKQAKIEELTGQLSEARNKYDELNEGTKDYQSIKESFENLKKENETYKTKETNKAFYDIMRKAGVNEEFIDDGFFAKVPKTDNPEDYAAKVTEFLKAKPVYANENHTEHTSTYDHKGNNEPDFSNMSDEEMLAYLKEQNQ